MTPPRARVRSGGPAAARVQPVSYTDGRCVQVLHNGPYSDEPASLARMASLMKAEGLVPHGLHHEVHLSDPREEDPAKMRTILRQPVCWGTVDTPPQRRSFTGNKLRGTGGRADA
ncbi:GyrI-like domain-containing protein [Spirillospora sp. CA-108201]